MSVEDCYTKLESHPSPWDSNDLLTQWCSIAFAQPKFPKKLFDDFVGRYLCSQHCREEMLWVIINSLNGLGLHSHDCLSAGTFIDICKEIKFNSWHQCAYREVLVDAMRQLLLFYDGRVEPDNWRIAVWQFMLSEFDDVHPTLAWEMNRGTQHIEYQRSYAEWMRKI